MTPNCFYTIPICCGIFPTMPCFESCVIYSLQNWKKTFNNHGCCYYSVVAVITQFPGGSIECFGTYHAELTKPKKIQPESRTVCMDECHFSASMPGLVGKNIRIEFRIPMFHAALLCIHWKSSSFSCSKTLRPLISYLCLYAIFLLTLMVANVGDNTSAFFSLPQPIHIQTLG